MSRVLAIASLALGLSSSPIPALSQDAPARLGVLEGTSIVITSSVSGKTLYGYSVETGTWDGIAIEKPDRARLVPVVGSGFGCVAVGKKIHAFSGTTGRWATIELPEEVSVPQVMTNRIQVVLRETIYLFSAKTGTWSTLDRRVDKQE